MSCPRRHAGLALGHLLSPLRTGGPPPLRGRRGRRFTKGWRIGGGRVNPPHPRSAQRENLGGSRLKMRNFMRKLTHSE